MDRVFVISENGADFLRQRFPESRQKIEVARLGTLPPEGRAQCSSDGTLRLVSCSTASPVKRLDRIVEVAEILSSEKDRKVEWLHFGGGPELNHIRELCYQLESPNLTCNFAGNTPLEDILRHYVQKPVDVFINSSRSEGIPVSMMEAMSAGIPCVAPSVGGIPELLQEGSGGVMISPEAPPKEIADACLQITADPEAWTVRSNQAFESWSKNYSANNNFSRFAQEISAL
jgi:glycosyltransferase involved in cell wall biosynthesis